MSAFENEVRELSFDEINAVSGGGGLGDFLDATKKIMDNVPDEAKFIGTVGVGMMAGAVGGPIGAVAGGVIAGAGYILSQ